MFVAHQPHDEKPRFAVAASRHFRERLVEPQRLGIGEVDAVLGLVGLALALIELKRHARPPLPEWYGKYTLSTPFATLAAIPVLRC